MWSASIDTTPFTNVLHALVHRLSKVVGFPILGNSTIGEGQGLAEPCSRLYSLHQLVRQVDIQGFLGGVLLDFLWDERVAPKMLLPFTLFRVKLHSISNPKSGSKHQLQQQPERGSVRCIAERSTIEHLRRV